MMLSVVSVRRQVRDVVLQLRMMSHNLASQGRSGSVDYTSKKDAAAWARLLAGELDVICGDLDIRSCWDDAQSP